MMTKTRTAGNRLSHGILGIAGLGATLFLAACGSFNGPEAAQYDASRVHPISVEPTVVTMMVDASRDKVELSVKDKDAITEFVRLYKQRGHGPLTISAPSGSPNTAASVNIVAAIRDVLLDAGVTGDAVGYAPYRASGEDAGAPVVLSYSRYVAQPSACGNWSQDLGYNPQNTPPPNLGCATQNNLAVMVADPADLLGPRDMSPADAGRRTVVVDKYRKGEVTGSARAAEESGMVSEVSR